MERITGLTWRAAGPVLAAVIAGLFFAPVYGLTPLLAPVLIPAAVVLAVTLICGRRPVLLDWRPLLSTVAGLLAVAETLLFGTTLAGLPTGSTITALAGGVTSSWQQVLESTWPARPDAGLLLFVPLLVTVAAVLGAELVLRLRSPLAALLPSLAVVVLSQCYAALTPGAAVAGALAYAVAAALTLATRATLPRLVAAGAASVLLAGLCLVLLPDGRARFSLYNGRPAPVPALLPANPLDEVAFRLGNRNTEVFRVARGSDVDRWPLVVLDDFDGVSWNPSARYRRMGTLLPPGPQVLIGTSLRTADLTVTDTGGPWLPSQTWPASVTGIEPLVIPEYGTLLREDVPSGPTEYTLSWWQPDVAVDGTTLGSAAIDPTASSGLNDLPDVPDEVQRLADEAMSGQLPTFQGALVLEKFLSTHYHAADGRPLPTGHGWPQIKKFLLDTKDGTSEQFAAAYVALARIVGIPARLVVGYRTPRPEANGDIVVRNGNIYAWPEVAVQGVGWVPLDPFESASGATATAGTGLAAAVSGARAALPPTQDLREPQITTIGPAPSPAPDRPVLTWTAVLAVLLLGWPVGVPALWTVRSWRRRRRDGAAAVLGAWAEVRDRLRAYGVPVTPGMTVRDLGAAAGPVADDGTVAEIRTLAKTVDRTLWSGARPADEEVVRAWTSVRAVRGGLARRGRLARVRALLNPRPLLPPASDGRRRRGWPWAR
ncbi:transglutaminaseTgpA domain-containing protein [Actinoplanes sp. NPDC051470]|uniref:transglutaminase family protein n=1 Tax=Actinoplanes sp. NPDC051470 TaxID=3157224 RepID=UPI003420B694